MTTQASLTEVTVPSPLAPSVPLTPLTPSTAEPPLTPATPSLSPLQPPQTTAAQTLPTLPQASIEQRAQQQVAALEQQRMDDLAARERRLQQQEEAQTLQNWQNQYAAELEQRYGLTPEHAGELAAQQGQILFQTYQQQQAAQQQVREEQARVQMATQLAQQHGVSVTALMAYNSSGEMRNAAERLKAEDSLRAEVQQLRTEIAKLTKGQVPSQQFNPGVIGVSPGVATADNIDALWLRWESQNPNQPNPYGDQYRKLLNPR